MVRVRDVRMAVAHRHVRVRMAVCAVGHRVMHVVVVPIVVPVGMLMRDGLMKVCVLL